MAHPESIEVVALGASAGGVEALTRLVSLLPADFPAAVFVVLHLLESGTSRLAAILGRAGALPVETARDGAPVVPGRVAVAPPGVHLTLDGAVMRLGDGPRERGHRPAVDPLFRSVAEHRGPRAAAVVLSGTGSDGTRGLLEVKRRGGVAFAQDPAEARYDGMPRSARTHVALDGVLGCEALASTLVRLATAGAGTISGALGHPIAPTPDAVEDVPDVANESQA